MRITAPFGRFFSKPFPQTLPKEVKSTTGTRTRRRRAPEPAAPILHLGSHVRHVSWPLRCAIALRERREDDGVVQQSAEAFATMLCDAGREPVHDLDPRTRNAAFRDGMIWKRLPGVDPSVAHSRAAVA